MNAVLFDVALTAYILAAAAARASLVWRRDDLSRVARPLTQAGWVCHTAAIVLRGVELGRAPVLTLAEVVSVVIWLAVFLDLWVERRYGITTFGAFVLPVVLALGLGLPTGLRDLAFEPQASTAWILVHVALVLVGLAALVLNFGSALMYVLQERQLKARRPGTMYYRMPSLETLDPVHRWEAGRPLLADTTPAIPAASVEDLLGPVMERLAADGPEAGAALRRFAEAWDAGQVDAAALLPGLDRDPAAQLQERFGLGSHLGAFLPLAALRPALEAYFEGVRELPEVWTRGGCPWCGGAWIAARLKCPFCESWNSRDLARLVAEELDEGYFIEACRACRGYLKGVDRRQRRNAGSPVVEDWGSPHLDIYAAREGYWRSAPSLAHLLPADAEGHV